MEKNIYSKAKVSVRVLDAVIIGGLVCLAAVIAFLSVTGGFDVRFDTDGGSEVAVQRLRYGEKISEPEAPTKQNCVFVGWYADEKLSREFDFESTVATEDITVYAAWEYEK